MSFAIWPDGTYCDLENEYLEDYHYMSDDYEIVDTLPVEQAGLDRLPHLAAHLWSIGTPLDTHEIRQQLEFEDINVDGNMLVMLRSMMILWDCDMDAHEGYFPQLRTARLKNSEHWSTITDWQEHAS